MLCQAAGDSDNKRKDNVNPVLPCELQGTERVPWTIQSVVYRRQLWQVYYEV